MPLGNEFQVNVETLGSQVEAEVAADSTGDFVVVWGVNARLYGRQFSADGTPGNEFEINDPKAGSGFEADVDAAPSGEFAIAWRGQQDTIYARSFDATGMPLNAQILVDDAPIVLQQPTVGMDASGDFVVVWNDLTGDADIFFRQFSLAGGALGGPIVANSLTTGGQGEADVSMADDGRFVVVWTSSTSVGDDSDLTSIQGRVFAADGQPDSDQFQVNSVTTSRQDLPTVNWLNDGGFVVAWTDRSYVVDTSNRAIALQRFDAAAQPQGPWMTVNTYTTDRQYFPKVAALSDGGFVVTWESLGSAGDDNLAESIQGRTYNAAGMPEGDQFQVNTYRPFPQTRTAVAGAPNEEFIVVWQGNNSPAADDQSNISGQRFGPRLEEIFADGFESSDTDQWSSASGLP